MSTYSYEQAKKRFDVVLQTANIEGKVIIRKEHELYILMPMPKDTSPLDIEGIYRSPFILRVLSRFDPAPSGAGSKLSSQNEVYWVYTQWTSFCELSNF